MKNGGQDMAALSLERLSSVVSGRIEPFLQEVMDCSSGNLHSLHIVGSSLTQDFDEKASDINSIVVLKSMDLKFVEFLAPLGKKHRKKAVAAPLIMSPDYIASSLDVFPLEFLNFKLMHETVFGEDILKDLKIEAADLRRQCEREIKSKLIGLRQGYISSMGDRRTLTGHLAGSIAGCMPLFRGIISLMGKEPPLIKGDVIAALSGASGEGTEIFGKVLALRKGKFKPTKDDLDTLFEEYYHAAEKLGNIIDALQI
jgi:hypothetical protein